MATIKESSTIQANKSAAFANCPVTFVMEKIGGYWKPIILFNLLSGPKRYSELRKAIPHITEKVLIQQLKQLEADKLLSRKALAVVPPHVTYHLTASGKGLRDVLFSMAVWAVANDKKNGRTFARNLAQFPSIS